MRAAALAPALALALALVVPFAAALDALPDAKFGATEARLLVRVPEGGAIRVEAGAGARGALASPGGAPGDLVALPATFVVPREPPDRAWHGLPGTVEVVVQRASGRDAMEILVSDDAGGAAFEWPAAARSVAGAADGAWLALVVGAVAFLRTSKGLSRRPTSPGT